MTPDGPSHSKSDAKHADARNEQIATLVRQRGFVTIEMLAQQFGVTVQTIRRDLAQLSKAGKVSRFHGGAYVVFSRELQDSLRSIAVEGSYASVIGGGPAATVVFARDVRERVAADLRIEALRARLQSNPSADERAAFDRLRRDVTIEKRAQIAAEFDAIHTVGRAQQVGSLEGIIPAREIRPRLIGLLDEYRTVPVKTPSA